MKKLLSTVFALVLTISFHASHAQVTSKDIIDEAVHKHLAAIAGLGRLSNLQSLRFSCKADNEFVGSSSQTIVVGTGFYSEQDNAFGNLKIFVNKKNGWTAYTFGETKEVKEMEELDRKLAFPSTTFDVQKMLISEDLISYAKYGNNDVKKVDFIGGDTANGKKCLAVQVTRSSGKTIFYLDTANWYCVKRTVIEKKDGKTEKSSVLYDDFRKDANGLVFPFRQTILTDDKVIGVFTYTVYESAFKEDKKLFTYEGK